MKEIYMGKVVQACKLGLNQTTKEGSFYPRVDGKVVGENDRSFYETEAEAMAVAKRFVFAQANHTTTVIN